MINYIRYLCVSWAVLGLIFVSVGICSAIQINVVDGDWLNPNPINVTISNSPGQTGGISNVSWGIPATDCSLYPSSYDFESRKTSFDAPTDGTPFALGDFRHNNFTIYADSTMLQRIDLALEFNIAGQVFVNATYNFSHNETPNFTTYPSDDIVTLSNPLLNPVNFSYDGNDYIFTLLGFSQVSGGPISTIFQTQENYVNIATLYGQITTQPVPEPATMLLLGSGLVGMGFVARRRKK